MKHYFKWFLVAGLNSILCMLFALNFLKTIFGALGILAGFICFIALYARIDQFLLATKKDNWRKSLLFGAITMGAISAYPAIPMLSGYIALEAAASVFNLTSTAPSQYDFYSIFFTTIITGLILSCGVIINTLIIRFGIFAYNRINDSVN